MPSTDPPAADPDDDAVVRFARAMLDLDIAAENLPGVRAALAQLADHGRRLEHG